MAQLIPVMCDEVVPGDFFQIGNQAVVIEACALALWAALTTKRDQRREGRVG